MYLVSLRTKLERAAIIPTDQIVPCSRSEIAHMEKQLNVQLPQAYREFLLWMGHGAGRFLRGSTCFYQDLGRLKESATELLNENNSPLRLPDGAFVFFMHQGYQFCYLLTHQEENPPVYFYGEWKEQTSFEVIFPHYSDFLETEFDNFLSIEKENNL
jgi:hypothetical protein